MTRSARVTSIDALRRFLTQLGRYESDLDHALTHLTLETRRVSDWIENDRPHYWRNQQRRASDAVVEARSNLERRQLTVERPGACRDEKIALERAIARLRYCEQRAANTQRWQYVLRQQIDEIQTLLTKANTYLEQDVPQAVTDLQRMAAALEQYADLSSDRPTTESPSGTSSTS